MTNLRVSRMQIIIRSRIFEYYIINIWIFIWVFTYFTCITYRILYVYCNIHVSLCLKISRKCIKIQSLIIIYSSLYYNTFTSKINFNNSSNFRTSVANWRSTSLKVSHWCRASSANTQIKETTDNTTRLLLFHRNISRDEW